ncbi:MAG: hypothetical protein CMB80_31855 [Flammeovirgaceae bacterium]|nr:hypothetical protein [Flammeovirgaceae bacterium]MBE62539.1 hypothetical protein [Flammeovirgaceae bacterium]MBR08992.1 hypothetical protein [Rickettsiales bacterium]|tara:strand:- start:4235 stop:4672 length:438 start_codon:yes stop_codon:yes gene_type:complete
MIAYLIVKYIHFISIFLVVGSLTLELILIKNQMKRKDIVLLARIDMIYGLATIVVLAAGFILWFAVGKPAEFYSSNWIFILKLILFGIIGVLSIIPTVFFLKNRKGAIDDLIIVPGIIRLLVLVEIIILTLLPLCAVLMANGVGT